MSVRLDGRVVGPTRLSTGAKTTMKNTQKSHYAAKSCVTVNLLTVLPVPAWNAISDSITLSSFTGSDVTKPSR